MIKFIYRFIKHLLILLLVSIPLQIIGILILPLVVPFYDIGKLPRPLRYLDSADPFTGRNTDVIERINKGGWIYGIAAGTYGKAATVFNKYIWLAWRNPTNYFEYKVLGVQVIEKGSTLCDIAQTNLEVDIADEIEIGDTTYSGLQITEIVLNNKTYYEYYYIKTYNFKGVTKCLRFRLGYKLGRPKDIKEEEYIQQVFVISPFHSYTGK